MWNLWQRAYHLILKPAYNKIARSRRCYPIFIDSIQKFCEWERHEIGLCFTRNLSVSNKHGIDLNGTKSHFDFIGWPPARIRGVVGTPHVRWIAWFHVRAPMQIQPPAWIMCRILALSPWPATLMGATGLCVATPHRHSACLELSKKGSENTMTR